MPPNFASIIASIIIPVQTYNSKPHASFISMPQFELNASNHFQEKPNTIFT